MMLRLPFGRWAKRQRVRSLQSTHRPGLSSVHVSVLEDRTLLAAPTGLSLSPATVAENVPAGTVIGTFQSTDADAGESFTYSFAAGFGDTGNSAFEIAGNQLRVKAPLNFEVQSGYRIRVRTTDSTNQKYENDLWITVTDVLEPIGPAIDVDPAINQVIEHSPGQTPVGVTINAIAPDSYVSYALLDDAGGRFWIDGQGHVFVTEGSLLDYDTATSHTITVRAKSSNGTTSVTTLTINVKEDTTPFTKPELLRDINQFSDDYDFPGYPSGLVQAGSKLFYIVRLYDQRDTDGDRIQLAVSDGTTNGTSVIAEFDDFIGDFEAVGETLYFINTDSQNGRELWKSDGTAAGTMIVKDIVPGPGGSGVYSMTSMNGVLYFTANDVTSGYELWRSDGTAAGTVRVTDLVPGSGSSFPIRMTPAGDRLYFMATDGVTGRELWASDGTAAGTYLVKDINPGPAEGLSRYQMFSEHEGTVYFAANDGVHGIELWRTDGTAAGTSLVKDIAPGAANATEYFPRMVFMDGRGYFIADDGVHGEELFRTDGTEAGTSMVVDIWPGEMNSYVSDLTVFGGKLYFGASNKWDERQLWTSDGTVSGTVMVKKINSRRTDSWNEGDPGSFVEYKGTLHFFGESYLWKTDGTAAGTVQVAPITGYQARVFDDKIYFLGTDGRSPDLWKSDGTYTVLPDGSAQGTVRVGELIPGEDDSNPRYFTVVNGVLYFSADEWTHGAELWRTDGTRQGTWLVKDLNPGSGWTDPRGGRVINGVFYFNGRYGFELWKSDGTEAGTTLVQDFGLPTGQFSLLGALGNTFLLEVTDAAHGRELWTSDGTAAGTQLLMDIRPGKETSYPHDYVFTDSRLFFFASTNRVNGYGLWETDGTTAGTVELVHFSGNPSSLMNIGERVFFIAADASHGSELWTSDGTVAGTHIVKDIFAGATGSSISEKTSTSAMTEFDGRLYFSANDGIHGKEYWVTDGTEAGTIRLSDITPGIGDSTPAAMGVLNGEFYFTASEGTHRTLWKTDGTPAGTQFVVDLTSMGLNGASTAISFRGRLYFDTSAGPLGQRVLASTDGTAAGTSIVTPLPGRTLYSTTKGNLVLLGSKLVFAGKTDSTGGELWAVDLNSPPTGIELATSTIPENNLAGATVGLFQSTDLDSEETLTYTLVPGLGDTDNSAFEILGNELRVRSSLNFESRATYSVRVRTTDAFGLWFERELSIAVIDVDEFDVSNPVDLNPSPNSISENASNGSVVGITAFASDADGTNNVVTYSLTDNAGGRFAINASGVVSVAIASLLNYESATSHSITVRAASSDGSVRTQLFTISLIDVDEFDVTPITDTMPAANVVSESASTGALVGITAFASDADASNSTVTYSLTENAGGRFAINPTTGVVTVASNLLLDYESASSHLITVQAASGDGSTSSQSFTIQITNVNEPPALSLTDPITVINENSPPPPILAEINILDDGTGAIQLHLAGLDASYFVLSGMDLRLSSSLPPDFELKSSYHVTIIVDDPSLGGDVDASLDFTLSIVDLNEAPRLSYLSTINGISETQPADQTYARVQVLDDALGSRLLSLSGPDAGFFQLVGTNLVPRAGFVLDYETKSSYTLSIDVDDPALGSGVDFSLPYTLQVFDWDEFNVGAITDTNASANSVPEHSPVGTPVGVTAFASDADGSNSAITYSLWDTRSGRFAINPVSGVITVANSALLDREGAAAWSLTVLATSQDGSVSVKEFTVNLIDVDEYNVGNLGDFDPAGQSIPENAPNGTLVGITVKGYDADATNNVLTYSLTQNPGGRFAIDPVTGVVTVANSALLDREAAIGWSITARGTSADGSFSLKGFTIALTDVDEYDVGSLGDFDSAPQVVAENSANGTLVGLTVKGFDADATNSAITYSLVDNAGGRFQINPVTGVVTVANGTLLDREAAAAWAIIARATSQDGSFSTKTFAIALSDVNDVVLSPVSDVNAAVNTVVENSAPGTLVGLTARAIDGDATSTVTYSLTNNAGGRFQIDPTTGVVSVAAVAVLDFETQTSHDITVKATSSDGSTSSQTFTIAVTNVFDAPRITLSSSSVAENRPSGTVVGTLGTADVTVTSPVYTLVTGAGSTDNSRFQITGNQLKTRSSFNFETKSSYSIRVQMRSATGGVLTQVFTIQVTDVAEGAVLIVEKSAVAKADSSRGDALNYTLIGGRERRRT